MNLRRLAIIALLRTGTTAHRTRRPCPLDSWGLAFRFAKCHGTCFPELGSVTLTYEIIPK